MRKKYYHAATPETMEKIIADGVVKRGWDGCVYLCEKPQDAAKFVAIRGHDEVAAEELPKACTACPFWLVEAEKFEEGECFLTGRIIKTDGSHDEKRMDDCPIIQRKKKRKAKRR